MKSKYNYELIHDYLHGLIDSSTVKEMGELLKNDETARSIAEGIVRLENEFHGDGVAVDKYFDDFRQGQLRLIKQKISSTQVTRKIWFRMAASLLLLISVGVVVRLMVATPDLQTLVNKELAKPYPLSNLVRGEGDGSEKEKAFQLYAQGDFAKASVYFEKAASEEKENASIAFYSALSCLYLGNFDKANGLLEADVIAGSRYSQQADWYQVLAFVKSGRKSEAIEILTIIGKDKQHFKHAEALQILRQFE